jgi:multidrug efflux pump subunit AcrA (membrane-fusion protein)
MRLLRLVMLLLGVAALAGVATVGYLTRDAWTPWLRPAKPAEPAEATGEGDKPTGKVLLTDQAITNLGLTAEPLKAQPYWKTILVPGMVVDRPGQSDRGVVSPVAGVVMAVTHAPGDTVRPGEVLFTLRVLSEPFHQTQTDLFKATQDIKLARAERDRLAPLAGEGIKKSELIQVDNQIKRLGVEVRAARQELLNRGLTADQVDRVTEGTYVQELQIAVPSRPPGLPSPAVALIEGPGRRSPESVPSYELQELKVELGHPVQAGQTLCLLANHRKLAVEGRAFPDETPLLERAVKEGWPVEVDFQEPPGSGWPAADHALPITHLANTIDPANRTFAFLMPLENQSRVVERDGRTQMLWRFRPGQKVRLRVRVERMENVYVLPADAVTRDGPEAFVFTQNVNTFERRPVRVLLADRDRVVVANDGTLPPGVFVAQAAAAQLNRMAKSQSNAVPKGYHVHADGSLHKNEDEGK